MALINCPDCSTSVSDQAISCLKCGRPIKCETQRLERQELYQKRQQFFQERVLPGTIQAFKAGLVLITTGLMGVGAKFLATLVLYHNVLNKISSEDLVRYLLTIRVNHDQPH